MIELVDAGHTQAEVARRLNVSRATVNKWCGRFRLEGEAGLFAGRHVEADQRRAAAHLLLDNVGLRMVSPIAIGVSQVSTLAFTLLNIASAVVWALVFTAVGYWFGETIEATFGRFKGMEHRLTVAVVVLVGVAGVFHLAKWTWSRWQARAG